MMTDEQRNECHAIIHTAAVAAGGVGAGLAQFPLTDNAVITPIQITMIVALGVVFDTHITDSVAKGATLGGGAGYVGRATVQVLLGWWPGLGNAVNAATAIALTEAIGWAAADKFANGELR